MLKIFSTFRSMAILERFEPTECSISIVFAFHSIAENVFSTFVTFFVLASIVTLNVRSR